MTWLWVILIVSAIGGLLGYFGSEKNRSENAINGAVTGGIGCGYIILQIFFAFIGLWLLFKVGSWLFG
jgi:hypothetical protein